jgi:hypothetical protein
VPIVLLGDTVHNFTDGLMLAAAFLVDPQLGWATALAIAAHEIPQEAGDFILLLAAGWRRSRALLWNGLSSLAAVLGGLIGHFWLSDAGRWLPHVLVIAAASFIYLAVSDLMPWLRQQEGDLAWHGASWRRASPSSRPAWPFSTDRLGALHERTPRPPRPRPPYPRHPSPAALVGIFEPDVQLAIWQRPADPLIADYLEASRHGLGRGLRTTLDAGRCPELGELPDHPGREALARDIGQLAELLGDLLDCPHVGLRLEVIDKAMCPRLHVDRVGIRLLCTYRGRARNGWTMPRRSQQARQWRGRAAR